MEILDLVAQIADHVLERDDDLVVFRQLFAQACDAASADAPNAAEGVNNGSRSTFPRPAAFCIRAFTDAPHAVQAQRSQRLEGQRRELR
jgi:hypothetical protein